MYLLDIIAPKENALIKHNAMQWHEQRCEKKVKRFVRKKNIYFMWFYLSIPSWDGAMKKNVTTNKSYLKVVVIIYKK